MALNGETRLIAHIGYPTTTFKSPLIYNPYLERQGLNVAVVPFGVKAEDFDRSFAAITRMTNVMGALITMPHKVSIVPMLAQSTPAVQIAGSCNAVRWDGDGRLIGDLFDGEGFVRGMLRKGFNPGGARAFIVGAGGVGSAIAASLAASGLCALRLFDVHAASAERLAGRLRQHYPSLDVETGLNDPEGCDIVVNATPLGMKIGDPMPTELSRIAPAAFVGEVVLRDEVTAFLAAAIEKGCPVQPGLDMLFEQIPAYLGFFGLPTATADDLRRYALV
ncbi:AroE Shikimate 5-dehydrogenase [Rhabdaerophilaceae bacterium]